MSHKIQITVDDKLNDIIRASAKQMGLSVSSYARLALINVLKNNNSLLNQAIKDVGTNNVETVTTAKFNKQLDNL